MTKQQRINDTPVTFACPRKLCERMDKQAHADDRSRSDWIRRVIREALNKAERKEGRHA